MNSATVRLASSMNLSLFDQLVGFFRDFEVDTQRLALVVDLEFHLVAVEVDGPMGEASLTQLLRQLVEG